MLANMSIEPIITLYVAQLVTGQQVTFVAGLVMAAAALGSILSASRLGRLADRVGHWQVIIGCLLVGGIADSTGVRYRRRPIGGAALLYGAGIGRTTAVYLPCIASVIRHTVPPAKVGGVLGLSTSAQYVGQVTGPLLGGVIDGHFGMWPVFLGTCLLLAVGAGRDDQGRP